MDYYFQFVLNCCQWASFTVVPGLFIMSPYFLVFPYFPRTLDPFIVESYLEMEICILVVSPANRFYYFLEAKKARRYTLHKTHTHTHTHIPSFQNMFLKLCQYQMDQQVSVDFLFLLHCLLVCDILSSLHPIPAWEARPSKAAIGGISENNIVFKKHCCPFLIPLSMIRPCHLISLSNISRK